MSLVRHMELFPNGICIEDIIDSTLVGDNTLYPVGLTLDQCLELIWRAKSIEVDYGARAYSYSGGAGVYDNED